MSNTASPASRAEPTRRSPLAHLPAHLRRSFELSKVNGVEALCHRDVAAGANSRANDIHDAERALVAAGFDAFAVGSRVEVYGGAS